MGVFCSDRAAVGERYEVRLPLFNGPLNLLLQLIERRELDITLVSLAAVADQYVEYVNALPEPDPDQLADFLVIAAKLLAIKVHALIARPDEEQAAEIEDDEDLVRLLQEYQQFKHAADRLRELNTVRLPSFARCVPVPTIRVFDPDGICLADLTAALRRRLAEAPPEAGPQPYVEHLYTIQDQIAVIEAALSAVRSITFRALLPAAAPPAEIVVTFMALLELLKCQRLSVMQSRPFGEIHVFGPVSSLSHPATLAG